MNSILLIISVVLILASIGYTFFYLVKFVKDLRATALDKTRFLNLLIPMIVASFAMLGINLGRKIIHEWNMDALHIILVIVGSLIFPASVLLFINAFTLRYYKKKPDLVKNQYNLASKLMFISIPVILVSLLLMLEGLAPYVQYPLTNGFSLFTKEGWFVLTRYGESMPESSLGDFNLHIAWYGVIIVSGAVLVYFISDHKLYKIYKQHGLLDTCFIIAFPMGIIGARLWYCLILKSDFYLANPVEILKITDGGLAVQGGALLGIISGVTYMVIFKKFVAIRECIDLVVPTILIAQAIGRWGNFFNHEVYGNIVNTADMWFFPQFIKNQMLVDFSDPTKMYLPLFLIESIINICGYFIISRLVGVLLRKARKYPHGTLGALYLVWYGVVRLILEPLRYGAAGEKDKFMENIYTSIGFVVGGLVIIGLLCLYEYVIKPAIDKKKAQKAEQ